MRMWGALIALWLSIYPSTAASQDRDWPTCPDLLTFRGENPSDESLLRGLTRIRSLLRSHEEIQLRVAERRDGTRLYWITLQAKAPIRFESILQELRQDPDVAPLLATRTSGWTVSEDFDNRTRSILARWSMAGALAGASWGASAGARWEQTIPFLPDGTCTVVGAGVGLVIGAAFGQRLAEDTIAPSDETAIYALDPRRFRKVMQQMMRSQQNAANDITAVLRIRPEEFPRGIRTLEPLVADLGFERLPELDPQKSPDPSIESISEWIFCNAAPESAQLAERKIKETR